MIDFPNSFSNENTTISLRFLCLHIMMNLYRRSSRLGYRCVTDSRAFRFCNVMVANEYQEIVSSAALHHCKKLPIFVSWILGSNKVY